MPRIYLGAQELVLRPESAFLPGREGTVYPDPSHPGSVIKLLHCPDDENRDKLRAMLAHPLTTPDVAWPTELALSPDRSAIVGYRMPYAAKKHPILMVYGTDPATRWLTADYGFRLDVAINFVAAVDRVHQHRCVVGDISPTNILVGKDSSVCLIDTDSFQIAQGGRIFRCKVGTPDYTPQELHGPKFADVDRTEYHDAFGVATMVFQLLVGPGTHSFAARHLGGGTPLSLTERIRLGIWPYARGGHPDYAPRTGAPLDLLHPLLRPLASRCFQAGHGTPTERPLPADWLVALKDAKQDTDFVRVVAPRLEAECQARQRQAVLAAIAPQTRQPGTPRASPTPRAVTLRRLLRRKVLATAAVSLVLAAAVSVFVATPTRPRIDFVSKAKRPLPAPGLYQSLSAERLPRPPQPPPTARSIRTPPLYRDIADHYR